MELWVVGASLGLHLPPEAIDDQAPAAGDGKWGDLPDPVLARARARREGRPEPKVPSRPGAGSGPTLNVAPGRSSARRVVGT